MQNPTESRLRDEPWCLTGIAAGTPGSIRESERRLSRERGHPASLYELVEDLMERNHLATSFTAPRDAAGRRGDLRP